VQVGIGGFWRCGKVPHEHIGIVFQAIDFKPLDVAAINFAKLNFVYSEFAVIGCQGHNFVSLVDCQKPPGNVAGGGGGWVT